MAGNTSDLCQKGKTAWPVANLLFALLTQAQRGSARHLRTIKRTPNNMNIFEQMLALAAIAVSGAGLKTALSTLTLRRRLK